MKRTHGLSLVSILLVLYAAASPLQAQWELNGVPVCTVSNNQDNCKIVSDGEGGAIIVWHDSRGANTDIYAQRVDAGGIPLWTPDGVGVCTYTGLQQYPEIVADGYGGAVIIWRDGRSGNYDIYAQRIDANGTLLWDPDGVAVCTNSFTQFGWVLTGDGSGGAVIAWYDSRISDNDIFAQRISSGGIAEWTTDGVTICSAGLAQYNPRIISDGLGGAVIIWEDLRNGIDFDLYVQRVNSNGSTAWTSNGKPVCTYSGYQQDMDMIRDGAEGYIVTWLDNRGGDSDIYSQRLSHEGERMWSYDGVAICTATDDQESPKMVSDGAIGAIIVWHDYRSTYSYDIYAQRIDPVGAIEWAADGVPVCDLDWNQYLPEIVEDGSGGAVIVWLDSRMLLWDIYIQRIDSKGLPVWDAGGIPLVQVPDTEGYVGIASDGSGGGIVCWADRRNLVHYDIYAQRMEEFGYWGYPAPSIESVRDIPGDQGGQVNLAFDASRLDIDPEELIYNYSIWRAIDAEAAAMMMKNGTPLLGSAGELDPGKPGPSLRREMLGSEIYYWFQVATVYASEYVDHYSIALETMFDSTAVSAEYHYFQVIAHANEGNGFWISAVDSGYSVDDLAPCPPAMLAGEQQYDPEGLQLSWDPNSEPDLDCYHIYRGTDESFVPGPGNFVAGPCDTVYLDGGWSWGPGYWYKVAAVDIHGNESGYSVLGPSEITGDDPLPVPSASYLRQNYPNPFNPQTTIAFGLKEPAHVSLRIFNAAGQLVRVLVNEPREARHYEEVWDGRGEGGIAAASGVYFYSLEAGEFRETRKMVLLR